MALLHQTTQIKWSASDSQAVLAGGSNQADVVTADVEAVKARLQVKAVNGGTPAAGDEILCRVLYTNGDPDADPDTADEYDTPETARLLLVLDTDAENPAIGSFDVSIPCKAFKLHVENKASANTITVSAQLIEQTAS